MSKMTISTSTSSLQRTSLLMTSSNSCNVYPFWVCLDIHCVGIGKSIENAQSTIDDYAKDGGPGVV